MILSVWTWLAGLFADALEFIFICVVCHLRQLVRAASADEAIAAVKKQGWRGQRPGEEKGWRCPKCAGG